MEQQAVYGIVFNEERDSVLLVQRRDIPVWVFPGGGLDPQETPEEGVLREVHEETGYQVQIVRKIAEYIPVNRLTQPTHFFECKIIGGQATTNAEAKTIQFFPLSHLPLLPPPFPGWIQDALSHHPGILKKKIEGVSYWILIKLLCQHPVLVVRFLLTKIGIRFNAKD
jgi:8-oxo-dGTP diphosphatase